MTGPTHPAALPVKELLSQCQITRQRRGGPGGQHRNKVETAVVISHLPSGVCGQASERRSQKENLAEALRRLRLHLALALRQPRAAPISASALWRSRVRGARLQVSPTHADVPALLAEALDTLAACGWNTTPAAAALEISNSQLVKFLAQCPGGLDLLNQRREALGLHRLAVG